MCLSLYLSLFISVYICLSLSFCPLSIYLCSLSCLYLSVCLSTYRFIFLSIYVCICVFTLSCLYLFLYLLTCPSIHPFWFLSFHLSLSISPLFISPFICMSSPMYLSVSLSICPCFTACQKIIHHPFAVVIPFAKCLYLSVCMCV